MLDKGIQVSISSDVPSFFYSEGVTLDFLMVTLAWSLDLKDLKKLALNGLNYSSISEAKKEKLRPEFERKWAEFVDWVLSTYERETSSSEGSLGSDSEQKVC